MRLLGEAGVPCGAVMDSADLFADEHLAARNMIVEIDHPVRGRMKMPGVPIKMGAGANGASADVALSAAPLLGADNDSVWGELGLGAEEIASLRADGVI
jgi:formyl-CoA transferase